MHSKKIKLVLKIGIILVILIAGFLYWLFATSKVEKLEIEENEPLTKKIEKADEWLQKIHEQNKFNGAVLLIKNDEVILKNTYGYTDFSRSKKLTTASSFRLASLSKQFTATGIMLLKERGKLDFDDTITTYLPNLKYDNVTIRHLLNHTSGIPDIYMEFPKKYEKEIGGFLEISTMVQLLGKENQALEQQPNDIYDYNNTGYVLLAAIIEKISGKPFEVFLQEELFDKLKMTNTRVWNLASKNKEFENKTSSFFNLKGFVTELTPGVLDGLAGDGSVFSSIDDFIIWNQFWCENSLLSEETMKEAYKKPILNDGKESNYGFGWVITKNNEAIFHNGSWLGARTFIIRNESLKNCIVLLDNSSSFNIDLIAQELVKVLK